MTRIDKAASARKGEELETTALAAFIRNALPDLKGTLMLKQFPGGHSNLTYLLTIGDDELILRRPPVGRKAKTAHDMNREYRVLSALHPVFPYCPKPLLYTGDESIIGAPFYLMERIRGMVLRRELPAGVAFTPGEARGLCEQMVDIHTALHAIDYKSAGLDEFGKPEGYIRRQVEGWIERYRQAHTADAPDYEGVMTWIHGNVPPDPGRGAIIHNDFKLDNMVVRADKPSEIIGVLDWEMATIGDPVMDIGNSLAYRVEPDDPDEFKLLRFMPPTIEYALTRRELVELYRARTGLSFDDINFFYCFGLFRLAVIAQQIYYRYYHRQTSDERFQMMILAVRILEKAALKTIERGFH